MGAPYRTVAELAPGNTLQDWEIQADLSRLPQTLQHTRGGAAHAR